MPTGLKVPIGVNPSGGAALVDGDDNDTKIISVALSDDDNENAFQQDIGLGVSMVFDINDPTSQARVLIRIERIFEQFRALKRFKLLRNTINWIEDSANQEMTLEFKYLNLESDETQTYEQTFNAG